MGSHANVAKTAVKGAENRIVGLDGLAADDSSSSPPIISAK